MSETNKCGLFNVGYVLACVNLVNLHGEPGMAADVLADGGMSLSDIKLMDLSDDDLGVLEELFREEPSLNSI